MSPKYLSVEHVAEMFDVSEAQVYGWINDGEFSVLRAGRGSRATTRIPVAELNEFEKRRLHPRPKKRGAA